MKHLLPALAAFMIALLGVFSHAYAQSEDEEKGRFTRFVEDTISTPDRRISIGSIDGVLSSDVRIDTITISDRQGVWLTIENAHLVWSRLALLRGRLDIDLLEAERIVISRPPLPTTTRNPAARPGFALPELPVEVSIGRLAVPEISIAAGVIGEDAARLGVDGSVSLESGKLASNVLIQRIDDKPGQLALTANFDNASRQLALDLRLEEPENGVVATLLGVPNRPAIAFTIAGSGPLDSFNADIALAAAGEPLVAGRATISAVTGGYRFVTDVSGRIGPLVPADYQDYVAGTSRLMVDALRADDGSVAVRSADLTSGVLSLFMNGVFAPDLFPTRIAVDGRLANPAGPVPIPGAGKADGARINVVFGGTTDTWTAVFDLNGLDTGELKAGRARIKANGVAENLADPAKRRLTFAVAGAIEALTAQNPDIQRALGDAFVLTARGAWSAGQPVDVEVAEIKNPNAAAAFRGRLEGWTLNGRYTLNAADVAPFAGLIGREIGGAVTLAAEGTAGLRTGALGLTIDADTVDLAIGNPPVDALLAGRTTLKGGAFRTTEGLRFDNLMVDNPALQARLNGTYDLDRADLGITAALLDVGKLTTRASGPLSLEAKLSGSGTRPAVVATLAADRLTLQGRTLTMGRAQFQGTLDGTAVDGALLLAGALDGVRIDGSARVATLADGTRRVDSLSFVAGGTSAKGSAVMLPGGLVTATIDVTSPDVAAVATLALLDASGALDANVVLEAKDGRQTAAVKASARDFRVEANRIGSATVDMTVDDVFGVPLAHGRFEAAGVLVGGLTLNSVRGTAAAKDNRSDFDIAADLAAGRLSAAGRLARAESGFDLTFDHFDLTLPPDLEAKLLAPVTVSLRGDSILIPGALLEIGEGRLTVRGEVADFIDLTASIDRLPLALGNAVLPDLALGGMISGSLTAKGPRDKLDATFDVSATGLTAAALTATGLQALDASAKGTYHNGIATFTANTAIGGGRVRAEGRAGTILDFVVRLTGLPASLANMASPGLGAAGTLDADLKVTGTPSDPAVDFKATGRELSAAVLRGVGISPLAVTASGRFEKNVVRLASAEATGGGVSLRGSGTVPIAGGAIDLALNGTAPLALANSVSPGLGAAGTVEADVTVAGTLADPIAEFNAAGRGVSAAALKNAGIQPLAVTAKGRFEKKVIRLTSAEATGGGLTLRASGAVPVTGEGLDIAVRGSLPLELANRPLAQRGAKLAGTATVDATVTGTVRAPRLGGTVSVEGASFVDPQTTTRLSPISLRLRLEGERAVIERFSAVTGRSGTLTATGTIGIVPGSGFPLDLALAFDRARFTDGRIVTATASGTLTAKGPATGNLVIAGAVTVERAEITVPERLPKTATLLDVQHRLPPRNVARTLERARLATEVRQSGAGWAGLTLNVTINAPRAVFVRGRGIDAELGGRVVVTGPISAIQPVGSLNLIRGRLDVIGQRITFTSGTVTLVGDLDPYIDLVATARANQITVTATVSGTATDPEIMLTSSPELPQDEILAQFLFGRSIVDLSPVQIARLAVAAAELTGGGGGTDLLGNLRKATGLDELDVVTDKEGGAAVQAGRYVSENVYLGVTAGSNGQSNVSVNLDLTDNLKARGEAGPSSGSKVGVFYEREY